MIDYATWCAIRDGAAQHLTPAQLAGHLGLDVKTARHWIDRPYTPRARVQRASKLDPFKGRIVGWLEAHALTAQQVFQRLCEAGYDGGISLVKDYVRTIRPPRREAFLTLAFAPGEMAQVDWGEFGTIAVGNTRRRLSFFVMVLAYSRQLYVEFTLAQTMEHFLAAHVNAFHALGVPHKVMVDNLRLHRETHRRPVDLWAEERTHLQPLNSRPFDVGRVLAVRPNRQFRVTFETNRYSIPARFAGSQVTLKAYPDRLCVYHGTALIARHGRSFERHQDIEDPDHAKALVAQRRHAHDAHMLQRFLGLSPQAADYHRELLERRGNALSHVRKIVALADIHGATAVVRALTDALAFEAFSSEYIAHLIEARGRQLPEPSPLVLLRRQDVLELELPPADLSVYDTPGDESNPGEGHDDS